MMKTTSHEARSLHRGANQNRRQSYPGCRNVVLHADDLGMNESVNAGILRAFSHGVLTSASVLANAPACATAIDQWKQLLLRYAQGDFPSLEARGRLGDRLIPFDLGIHLNLTQGRPLTGDRYPAALLDHAGSFPGIFKLASTLLTLGPKFQRVIEAELCAQIEVLHDCAILPSHLNAHQYVDLLPVVASIVPRLLKRYGIRVVRVPWERRLFRSTLWQRFQPRHWCLAQIKRMFAFHQLVRMHRARALFPDGYFGTAHAGQIDLALMQTFITQVGTGITEICLHPGAPAPDTHPTANQHDWHDPLAAGRSNELSLLTSPELVELLESRNIRLTRLSDLAARCSSSAAA
jgi:predicted glycoside hydrolase/deacetylase ChbG (UPF0249 family)